MFNRSSQSGFTIVELIVVSAILALVATISLQAFLQYARYQEYQQAVAQISQVVAQVQADARVARLDQHHGVHFTTDTVTQFRGDQYVSSDPANIIHSFPNVRIISTLTGGVSEVRLRKVSGLPSATGVIEVVGVAHQATTTFSISPAGVIEYN